MNSNFFVGLLIKLPVLLFSITVHEFWHAFSAYLLGDATARDDGRLTLNPLDHLDPVGTLCMVFGFFGWARPVPVNPHNARHNWGGVKAGQRSDTYDPRFAERFMLVTGLAGPASNLALAAVFAVTLRVLMATGAAPAAWEAAYGDLPNWQQVLCYMLALGIVINVALAMFNLLPLGPLDGHHIWPYFLPHRAKAYFHWLNQYGMYILLALILLPRVVPGVNPLWSVLEYPVRGFTWLVAGGEGQAWLEEWWTVFLYEFGSLRA